MSSHISDLLFSLKFETSRDYFCELLNTPAMSYASPETLTRIRDMIRDREIASQARDVGNIYWFIRGGEPTGYEPFNNGD